jgi:hypothetical protein
MHNISPNPVTQSTIQELFLQNRQSRSDLKLRLANGFVGIGVVAGLMTTMMPAASALVFDDLFNLGNLYERCTGDLLALKISTEEATSACARALNPKDLGICVSRTSQSGTIAATDALSACRQVRRPKEMAACVNRIRGELSTATALEVLDNCRRSLLPDRYANCVVGISSPAKLSPTQAMTTCIDTGYFPREVDPTFIPYTVSPSDSIQAPVVPATPEQPVTPAPQSIPVTPGLPQKF